MKQYRNLIIFLIFQFNSILGSAQTQPITPDEEMNIFLFTIAAIFICTMIGAAIIGAIVATVVIFLLLAFISAGILSTSVAVGLYKRSFSASFKTFLIIAFGTACSLVGTGSLFLLHYFVPLKISIHGLLLIGLVSGAIGGTIMALSTYTLIQKVVQHFFKKSIPA